MLLYAKYLLYTGNVFSFEDRIAGINAVNLDGLNHFIRDGLDLENYAKAMISKNI